MRRASGHRLHAGMSIIKATVRTSLVALATFFAGCGGDDTDQNCEDDRCNAAETRDELLSSIAGFSDPISEYLRATVQEDGSLVGDYNAILEGMTGVLGCEGEQLRSFMVLSNEALNPKAVFNHCANTPAKASEFFLLLPTLADNKDFEPQVVHMTAWDDEASEYRRFATAPRPGGGMSVNVQPAYCLTCHAGPRELGVWQPLMNEMTNPWSQWNAEPGFLSHVFDEYLPSASAEGDVFSDATAPGLLDSASNFEPIFRAGIDRITGARVQARNAPAEQAEALSLLQPLFCDEQANYVSEIHGSGEFRSSAVIDDSVRELLIALDVGDLEFVSEDTMRIAPLADGEANITLMPVRGESSLRSELALVTRQALSPLQVLQVRSIDWSRPAHSAFRCALFDQGSARVANGVLDAAIASLPSDATNAALLPILLAEIMTHEAAGVRTSLAPDGATVFSIPDAEVADFSNLGGLEVSPLELGEQMQASIDATTRESLDARRRERACEAAQIYLVAPLFPDIDC